jgi:uncharacterized membrane protein YphA (DoxX/SURF4 family)
VILYLLFAALPVLVGLVFIASGAMKFLDPDDALTALRAILPDAVSPVYVLRALIVVEAVLGLGLLLGPFQHVFAGLTLLVLISLSVGLTVLHLRGFEGGCGCFGSEESGRGVAPAILRNVFLAIATTPVILSGRGAAWSVSVSGGSVAAVLLGIGLFATAVYAHAVLSEIRSIVDPIS